MTRNKFIILPAVGLSIFLTAAGVFSLTNSKTESNLIAFPSLPTDNTGKKLVLRARSFLGTNYSYGGRTPETGFDCSGFVKYIYGEEKLRIPRTSRAQYKKLSFTGNPRPGDLVFFAIDGEKISHVGMYLSNYNFIHAPGTGHRVRIDSLKGSYWLKRYRGARRKTRL